MSAPKPMMANLPKVSGSNIVVIPCRFYPNSTSDPTYYGDGVQDVVHTSTGIWTIKLCPAVANVISVLTGKSTGLAGDVTHEIDNTGSGATATEIVVKYSTSLGVGDLADLSAGADTWISVVAYCEMDPGRTIHAA